MAYEMGGLSDKLGNRYEYRWLAEQLFRLSNEKIVSVMHESVGDIDDGVDLQIENINGSVELHQCKGSNGIEDKWTMSSLDSRRIFSRIRKHLETSENYHYKFISPLPCQAMKDLISRAKNSNNFRDFYEFQIKHIPNKNSLQMEKNFSAFLKYMDLEPKSDSNLELARNYLSRIEFFIFPDVETQKRNFIERLSDKYNADAENIFNLLVTYTIENDRLRHKITIAEINEFLQSRHIFKYDLSDSNQIWPRISALNKEFKSTFIPLRKGVLKREETKQLMQCLSQNNSILLHGKAGSGKSGCIQELILELEAIKRPYLAIKLDKHIPETSGSKFGTDILDLKASPVSCLSSISQGNDSVLILDQLDAIRWTSQHTRTALDVCKELINQTTRINFENRGKISIVFVCRTVDAETDNGIKSLFQRDKEYEQQIIWNKIEVKELSEETVKSIVGTHYSSFTPKFIKLLKNINNLYLWDGLDEERKNIQYASTYHLVQGYWEQFQYKIDGMRIPSADIISFKELITTLQYFTSRDSLIM